MIHEPKNCIICGKEFIPRNGKQVTCGSHECRKEMGKKYKYTKRHGEIKTRRRYSNMRRYDVKCWNALTSAERWKMMSLREISVACAKCNISYGKAQVMYQNNVLPEDFGKK